MPDFTTFSVLFFTRKLNRNKAELSIYTRITVNGKCSEMSLKRKTSVNSWDTSKGRVRGGYGVMVPSVSVKPCHLERYCNYIKFHCYPKVLIKPQITIGIAYKQVVFTKLC